MNHDHHHDHAGHGTSQMTTGRAHDEADQHAGHPAGHDTHAGHSVAVNAQFLRRLPLGQDLREGEGYV